MQGHLIQPQIIHLVPLILESSRFYFISTKGETSGLLISSYAISNRSMHKSFQGFTMIIRCSKVKCSDLRILKLYPIDFRSSTVNFYSHRRGKTSSSFSLCVLIISLPLYRHLPNCHLPLIIWISQNPRL